MKLESFIVLFWIYQSTLVKLVYFSNLIFIFLAFKFYKEKQYISHGDLPKYMVNLIEFEMELGFREMVQIFV